MDKQYYAAMIGGLFVVLLFWTGVVLVVLKLSGSITWSWRWTLSPFAAWVVLGMLVVTIGVLLTELKAGESSWDAKKTLGEED